MEEQAIKRKTPTEILIECMEDFGADEPEEVIVLYRTKSGDMAWMSNVEAHSHFIGMLHMTEFYFLNKRRKEAG